MASRKPKSEVVQLIPEQAARRSGIRSIVVVRESDAANRLLFTEMIYKTAMALRGLLPEVESLLELGLDPFFSPEKHRAEVTGSQRARTVLFMLGSSTLVMYHMGSAALDDGESETGESPRSAGRNEFTTRLIDLLERHRPETLFVYGVNRLVRSFANASRLQIALKSLGVVVRDRDREYDLNDAHHVVVWQILTSFAAAERDGIVDRNVIGRIAQARRNEWPHSREHVPFGYVREGRTIRPDDAKREAVGQVLQLLADPNLSAAEFVQAAADLGMSRPRLRRIHGDELAMVDVAFHPKDVRYSMLRWLELYESGGYRMHLPCPSAAGEVYGGLPVWVDATGSTPKRKITLRYEFGVPEDGWAQPSVFEAIRQRHLADKSFATTSVTRGARRPLAGRAPYEASDGQVLQVDSGTARGYRLRTVEFLPVAVARVGSELVASERKSVPRNARTLATFSIDHVHESVANTIVEALSSDRGVDGRLAQSSYLPDISEVDERRELLVVRIERLRTEARRAADNAARVENATARQQFIDAAGDWANQLDQASAELADLDNEKVDNSGAPVSVDVSSDVLARVLAKLARARGAMETDFVEALSVVLPRFEIHPTGDPNLFAWLATLRLPVGDNRVLELGPFTGELRPRSFRHDGDLVSSHHRANAPRAPLRVPEAVLDLWAQGAEITDLAKARGVSYSTVAQHVAGVLAGYGFPAFHARVLTRARPPELRQLALAAGSHGLPTLIAQSSPSDDELADMIRDMGALPDGCDPLWAALSLRAYVSGSVALPDRRWDRGDRASRLVVAQATAGECTLEDVQRILRKCHGSHRTIPEVIEWLNSRVIPVVPSGPVLHEPRGRIIPENKLRLIVCDICDEPMDLFLRVPEVPGAALCRQCRTSGSTSSPVYPESYFSDPPHVEVTSDMVCGSRPVVPSETAETAAEMYRSGVPVLEIVERLQITDHQVYAALDQFGVEKRLPYRRRNRSSAED